MSMPALRQPKFVSRQEETLKRASLPEKQYQYVIVTLKDEQKLVVSSDAYHGIITVGVKYQCVFCDSEMKLDSICKEKHKSSAAHRSVLENYPHVEDYAENLIRELTPDSSFCTICNVVIANVYLMRHLHTEAHSQELEKAGLRAATYKPL